jgi:hypothetical protein
MERRSDFQVLWNHRIWSDCGNPGRRLSCRCALKFRSHLGPIHSLSPSESMAGTTGLEPATSAVTGQRSNQLSYVPPESPSYPKWDVSDSPGWAQTRLDAALGSVHPSTFCERCRKTFGVYSTGQYDHHFSESVIYVTVDTAVDVRQYEDFSGSTCSMHDFVLNSTGSSTSSVKPVSANATLGIGCRPMSQRKGDKLK